MNVTDGSGGKVVKMIICFDIDYNWIKSISITLILPRLGFLRMKRLRGGKETVLKPFENNDVKESPQNN